MARAVVTLILCVAFDVTIGKYVFITQQKTWSEAQTYCRTSYTDLAYVKNEIDFGLLLTSSGQNSPKGWIGLYRDPYNPSIWRWSGAGLMTYSFWGSGQPNNYDGRQNRVCVQDDKTWNDQSEDLHFHSIASKILW
uniref:C-type lectin domain-containing protein n=1 Tax=Neogobius melanostomus TaxID=47308 RepID=A0A8C6WK84_9GOBI